MRPLDSQVGTVQLAEQGWKQRETARFTIAGDGFATVERLDDSADVIEQDGDGEQSV